MKAHPFVKFVSPVEGHHVTRYGTRTIIGGRRDQLTDEEVRQQEAGSLLVRGSGIMRVDPEQIVALTATEWATYRREYERALRDGSLTLRTEAEFFALVNGTPKAAPKGAERGDK